MKRVLIIDDEENLTFFFKKNLEFMGGYLVATASNGKEGLVQAHSFHPDIILLDVMMPGIDGFEVLKRIKADQKIMMIPVIMLTARDDDECRLKAASLYNDDYVSKPFSIAEVKVRIDSVLSRHGKSSGG